MMEFSQTRLKLRVAICPFTLSISGPEFHHRFIGMKREGAVSSTSTNQMILRQFLLLLPFDCTFSDLKSLVLAQYQKLYKNQPAYVQLKNILHFRDVNQCDLDLDYLVAEICASNDLIYVMVEIDDNSSIQSQSNNQANTNLNKKLKTSEVSVNKNIGNNTTNTKLFVSVPKVVVSQAETKPKPSKSLISNEVESRTVKFEAKNEKKVPEFKPTPIVTPLEKSKTNFNIPTPIKEDVSNSEAIAVVSVAPAPKINPSSITISTNINDQTKPKAIISPKSIKIPTQRNLEKIPETNSIVKAADSKTEKKEINKVLVEAEQVKVKINDEIKFECVNNDDKNNNLLNSNNIDIASVTEADNLALPSTEINENIETFNTFSQDSFNADEARKRSSTMITPSPTPILRPSPISRPIFNPRKISLSSTQNNNNSSDSEENSDDEIISKSSFDASSLFGAQIIASEPRRSDAFVLFEADSSGSSSDEHEPDSINVNVNKSSSIVSLQAEPSDELDESESSSSDFSEDDLDINSNSNSNSSSLNSLPQSVTLRRLNSVSPIPDPSEMPSLIELKESLNRAPTPLQILQSQSLNSDKNSKPSDSQHSKIVKKKTNHHYHHNNHNHQNQINSNRGRPTKKAHRGRPKAS